MIHIPAHDTWRGFGACPINGTRRSPVVNHVTGGRRGPRGMTGHELACPDAPIG